MAEPQKITAFLAEDGVVCEDKNGVVVKAGGGGPSATDLLLMSVAGCSGAVLRAVLGKAGYVPESVHITVEGERADKPRRFSRLFVSYDVVCPGLDRETLHTSIEATEKACPVIQTLSAKVEFKFDLKG